MREHTFQVPIAINRETNNIVHAKDVEEGLKCNCFCECCKEDLIAVNNIENKQKAHFRHNKNSKCSSNGETYIHWLTKEVFKDINQIFLPPITYDDLQVNLKANDDFRNKLKNYFEKKELRPGFDRSIFTDFTLQSESKIEINSCEKEATNTSQIGNIKVDIVLEVGGQKLFIEPYITSKIVENKREKLVDLNISTISIDLRGFVQKNDWNFKIEDFKNFLITNISNKKWEYIRTSEIDKLTDEFVKKLDTEIEEHETKNPQNKEIKNLLTEKQKKYKNLMAEFTELQAEIELLKKNIIPFPLEKLFHSSPLYPLQIKKNQF